MPTIVPSKYRNTIEYHLVFSELVRAAGYRGSVTYQELALQIGFPTEGNYMGAEIGHLLGEISEDEHSQSRPMLSAVAIGTSGYPGPGFFELARQLGKLNSQSREDERAFWKNELRALRECWKRRIRPQHGGTNG